MVEDGKYQHGYKFRIYPTDSQKELIGKFINIYRYIYNWALDKENTTYELYKEGKSSKRYYSFYELCKEFALYRDEPGNEWLKEIPNTTARLALKDVDISFKKFFKHTHNRPKFKTKKRSPKMFKTRNDRFYINDDRVRFEGLYCSEGSKPIVETVSLGFNSGFYRADNTKYMQPCISIDNLGRYWVSFSVMEPIQPLDVPTSEPIGIDVGVRQTIVTSRGKIYNRPKEKIKRLEKRLSRAHRESMKDINRRKKLANRMKIKYDETPYSKRAQKRADKVRKLYKKITNVKEYFYNNAINEILSDNPKAVVVETIHSRQLEQQFKTYQRSSRHAIHHADFSKILRIIKNKCEKHGIPILHASEKYPSSQICSNCGNIRNIGSNIIYTCPECGLRIDRDINAAINLSSLATQLLLL